MNRSLLLILPFTLCLVSISIFTSGCHKGPKPSNSGSYDSLTHEVKYSGENLSIIAHWYTGKASNWQAILNANPEIKNPQKLRIGSLITIPGELVEQRSPLTKNIVAKYSQKVTPTPAVSVAPGTTTPSANETKESVPTPQPETPTTPQTQATEVSVPTFTVPAPVIEATPTPFPELPTPSPSEIARDTLIDEILSEKSQ